MFAHSETPKVPSLELRKAGLFISKYNTRDQQKKVNRLNTLIEDYKRMDTEMRNAAKFKSFRS